MSAKTNILRIEENFFELSEMIHQIIFRFCFSVIDAKRFVMYFAEIRKFTLKLLSSVELQLDCSADLYCNRTLKGFLSGSIRVVKRLYKR